jgi:hypothetical protein
MKKLTTISVAVTAAVSLVFVAGALAQIVTTPTNTVASAPEEEYQTTIGPFYWTIQNENSYSVVLDFAFWSVAPIAQPDSTDHVTGIWPITGAVTLGPGDSTQYGAWYVISTASPTDTDLDDGVDPLIFENEWSPGTFSESLNQANTGTIYPLALATGGSQTPSSYYDAGVSDLLQGNSITNPIDVGGQLSIVGGAITVYDVPEPSTSVLLGLGTLGLLACIGRRAKA